ncbi:glycosyltransferase family 4 protein [Nocardioides carbamazepini]|uniref:glycosyltransferase family 4 protein n=1 Tax=Nocardioides carbamazepini TaxID=2854259 RepID=UPI002149F848|nr:glycosyltransferase family 4 protein [Nocardioides carbamazepini]MCR1782010.1 glycosyltransferase family 4 protein [Nocardioides carbamazepini]
MRVLHLIESLGGGVLSSVLAMVDATPAVEHHVAVWPRRSHADTGDRLDAFSGVHELRRPLPQALRAADDLVHGLGPDQVHAHSSYAGLLARILNPAVDVAYSPHCFAFERQDLGAATRAGVRRIERSLAGRTAVLVACSPREAALARALGHRRVVTVPNRALDVPDLRARFSPDLRVVTVGRIGPQKDWPYLLRAKGYLEDVLGCHVEWEWLGGGDRDAERTLRAHGVSVAGWLPRTQVLERLSRAHVYVHTAAWEGAPISILEAAALGLPLVVRGIPGLLSLDVPGATRTAADLADRIGRLRDPDLWSAEQQRSLHFAAGHTLRRQRDRLTAAYGLATPDLVQSSRLR